VGYPGRFSGETLTSFGSQRRIKIPLNPPFTKGEINKFPSLAKGLGEI